MQGLIDKMFEFYLIQNTHYLIQMKDGGFITRNDRSKPLRRFHVENHLNGKLPIGTFSGAYLTKFICFDVDYSNEPETAKWVTYKLAHTLEELGLHNYAISFSGSKGYHVELFYDKAISVDASRQFFDLIVQHAEVSESDPVKQSSFLTRQGVLNCRSASSRRRETFVDSVTLKTDFV